MMVPEEREKEHQHNHKHAFADKIHQSRQQNDVLRADITLKLN